MAYLLDDRFSFDFDQHVGGDEAFDLDHAGCRANLAEELAVRFADLLPVSFYVEDVYAGAHHVFEAGPGSLQRGLDVLEGLYSLRVGVADAYDLPVGLGGSSARDMYGVAYAHGPRVADNGFPGRACGDVLSLHDAKTPFYTFISVLSFQFHHFNSSGSCCS
jgi:hypothetical protein